MADLIEYIRWRGDLSFWERPFNEVDNLVLSQICYHCFDGIVPGHGEGAVTLRDAADRFFEHPERGEIPGQDQARNNEFLREVKDSERFSEILMRDYVNIIMDSHRYGAQTQFAAFHFCLPDESHYIGFRGTDNTVVGWREDFKISYMVTEAQEHAAEYLRRVMQEMENWKDQIWRVGGHSKGGNLALYSALCLPPEMQDALTTIYNNDGPGIAPEMFDKESYRRLRGRIRKIVPEYDIIGMLFEKREIRENPAGDRGRLLVVGSSEKGAMQHWALTWQVKRDHFERKTRIHPEASKIAEILDRWVTSASFEEREAFVSTLFDAMDQFGPAMSDVINAGLRGYNTILSGLLRGSPETRTAVGKYFQSLLNVGVESAVENVKEALESVGNAVRSRTKEIGEGREALEQALCEKDTERAKREDRDERLNNQIQSTKILESGGERDRENPPDLGTDLTGEEERWEKQEQAQAREQNQLRSLPGPVRKSRAQWGKKGRKKRASSLSWKMTKNRSSRP